MMETQVVKGTAELFHSATDGRLIHKYSNYFEIYDRYLESYKGRAPTILEIGVQHGGSLLMWDKYFDGKATIVGIDILPDCKKFETSNIKIFTGDQSDEVFLKSVIDSVGKFDIIIDDGSHIPVHQIKSFEVLFHDGLKDKGVYICEDCHSSYWPRYGGGLRRAGTFIEFAKRLCDQLNAWVADNPSVAVDQATRWIKSITFFSSVVVFEKSPMRSPSSLAAGEQGIDLESPFKQSKYANLVMPLKRNSFVQGLVRRNPMLWRMMRRLIG